MAAKSWDVIIVGAGVSGLAAARDLTRQGKRVLIVEAHHRVGGRILTRRNPTAGLPIELGADFVHGRPPESFEIIDRHGLDAYEIDGDDWTFDGRRLRKNNSFWGKIDSINGAMRRIRSRGGRDLTFESFLRLHCRSSKLRAVVPHAINFVEGFHAARIDRISVASIVHSEKAAEAINGEKNYRLRSGYDEFVGALRSDIDAALATFQMDTVIEEIDWRRRGAAVVHARHRGRRVVFRAVRVLITLPLGVLKNNTVRFTPPLKQKRAALERLEMGSVIKVVLQFGSPLWKRIRDDRGKPMATLSFLHAGSEALPTWWTTHPANSKLLTGWTGGPSAWRLGQLSNAQIIGKAVESLAHVFGRTEAQLRASLVGAHLHNWQADPFSQGAYSYIGVGGIHAPLELAKPLAGSLFFAGEATSADGHFGTVHGALGSGVRAAREILSSR